MAHNLTSLRPEDFGIRTPFTVATEELVRQELNELVDDINAQIEESTRRPEPPE